MQGIDLIAAERARQIEVEGYDAAHDRDHAHALTRAAACYTLFEDDREEYLGDWFSRAQGYPPVLWPWAHNYFKPTPDNRVRELTKAGALIAAAIDSLLLEQDNAGN